MDYFGKLPFKLSWNTFCCGWHEVWRNRWYFRFGTIRFSHKLLTVHDTEKKSIYLDGDIIDQGSTDRLVRGSIGSTWSEIYQIYLFLVRFGPRFSKYCWRFSENILPWAELVHDFSICFGPGPVSVGESQILTADFDSRYHQIQGYYLRTYASVMKKFTTEVIIFRKIIV